MNRFDRYTNTAADRATTHHGVETEPGVFAFPRAKHAYVARNSRPRHCIRRWSLEVAIQRVPRTRSTGKVRDSGCRPLPYIAVPHGVDLSNAAIKQRRLQ